jgi:hypothetical protein
LAALNLSDLSAFKDSNTIDLSLELKAIKIEFTHDSGISFTPEDAMVRSAIFRMAGFVVSFDTKSESMLAINGA